MAFLFQQGELRRQHARGQKLSTPSVFQESWFRETEEKKEKKENPHLLFY